MSTVTLRMIRNKNTYGYSVFLDDKELPEVKAEGLRSYSVAFADAQPKIQKLLKAK